jgi:hypothetical protein
MTSDIFMLHLWHSIRWNTHLLVHCKKRLAIIPPGDKKTANLFYSVYYLRVLWRHTDYKVYFLTNYERKGLDEKSCFKERIPLAENKEMSEGLVNLFNTYMRKSFLMLINSVPPKFTCLVYSVQIPLYSKHAFTLSITFTEICVCNM